MMRSPVKAAAQTAVFIAAALILSYLEAILPLNVFLPVPGFKLGLSNIIVLFLIHINKKQAMVVMLLKVLLSSILFGTAISFFFSISGGILSFCAMTVADFAFKERVTDVGLSAIGGVFHNLGQLCASGVVIGWRAAYSYLSALIISGVISGIFCGLVLNAFSERIKTAVLKIES